MKPLRNMVVGLLVMGAAGCGLSEYQSRMDAQRARIQRFDDSNQLLGDPIDIPTIPGRTATAEPLPAWPFDIFLRLPKGYIPEKKPVYTNFPCYLYRGPEPGYNVFVACSLLLDKDGKERYGESSSARFRELIRAAIDDFYFKNYKSDARFYANKLKLFLPADKIQYTKHEVDLITPYSDVRDKISYDFTSYKDIENKQQPQPLEFRVYLHEESGKDFEDAGKKIKVPGKQVAIVAQSPIAGANPQFDKSIQAALGTLDLIDVGTKRTKYKSLKGS